MLREKNFFSAKNVAYFAVLTALTVVLQLFAGAIPMFGVTLNFSLIPIVLAGIFFGGLGGGLLGFISGTIVFITAAILGEEPFTAFLFQASPVMLTVVCIGKTTVAGFTAGCLYRFIERKSALIASYVASITVAVLNTALYLLGMMLMKNDVAAYLGTEATAGVVFITVFAFIWLNMILEIAINFIVAPALAKVVRIVEKRVGDK